MIYFIIWVILGCIGMGMEKSTDLKTKIINENIKETEKSIDKMRDVNKRKVNGLERD